MLNIHQKIISAFFSVVFVISLYEQLFHFVLGVLHILFEMIEYMLDNLIEHLFDIGNRETEIVVFYILLAFMSYSLFKCYHGIPRWVERVKGKFRYHKNETYEQWKKLSALAKMAWWSFFIIVINCWLFLA